MSNKTTRRIAGLAAVVLLGTLTAAEAIAASGILDYEHRVVRAAEQIERIKADKEYGEEGISYIRRLLPRTEQIEFDQREVTVDNTWLYVLLDSYVAESDPQQRNARLNEAAGRLRALDEHLRRATAPSIDSGDAGEKIREILRRPPYQPEPETMIGRFVKSTLRKVREVMGQVVMSFRRLLERILGAGASGGLMSKLVLIGLLAVAGFLLVQWAYKMRLPRAKRKKTRLILGEEVAADETSGKLAESALAAARAGDFRTAIRKLYVSLLYELSERNLIELEDSATNHEYLRRVARFNVLSAPMHYMTDRFDYVWYGKFPSSEEDFAAYRARYEEAMQRAKTVGEQPASAG